jgi:hypothetical protein
MIAALCAGSPVAPPLASTSAKVPLAALRLPTPTNRPVILLMAFLQLGFATSHSCMLKVEVSFKSSDIPGNKT